MLLSKQPHHRPQATLGLGIRIQLPLWMPPPRRRSAAKLAATDKSAAAGSEFNTFPPIQSPKPRKQRKFEQKHSDRLEFA